MRAVLALLGCTALLTACGPDRGFLLDVQDAQSTADSSDAAGDVPADEPVMRDIPPIPVDSLPMPDMTIVYAHSDTTLYAVDPRTNGFRTVGDFGFPMDDRNHDMTDIAIDADGAIWGTTQNGLYRVNATTAACTLVSALPAGSRIFVGLTFLPVGTLDPNREVLVGGATDGTYWRIDTSNGNATMVGRFQNGWTLSGDIVSIAGAATYATVRQNTNDTDRLATINPTTGAVTIIGDTGVQRIFGLGYWRSTLYGFTRPGEFVRIDARNGRTTRVSMPTMQFSGAGVTTVAPTAPE